MNQELKEFNSNEILRMLTDNLPDMLWIKDKNNKYLFTNKAICDNLLIAKDTKEAINKDDTFFALRERMLNKDKKNWHTFGELCSDSDFLTMDSNKPMRFEEYGNIKGKFLYLEVHKAPFYDKEKNIIGTVGSARDITNQMKLKKELEELNRNLQYEINKKVNEIREKDKQLLHQSKLAQMSEMISMIAHQWRQPLTAISSTITNIDIKIEMGKFNLENQDEREIFLKFLKKKHKKISEYINILSDTVNNFRIFFKPNEEKEFISIAIPVIGALSMVKVLFTFKDIKIKVDYQVEDKILLHKNEVMQVIIDILSNAKDNFIARDIIDRVISVVVRETNLDYIIEITDNGGGIPDDIIDYIFDPYFSTKSNKNGTGLGLYMSKTIIEKHHNGKLNVFNTIDGVTFRIGFKK